MDYLLDILFILITKYKELCLISFYHTTLQTFLSNYCTYFYQLPSKTASAVCQATGDPHYIIWDGGRVHYQGLCTHLLAGSDENLVSQGQTNWKVR